MTRIAPRIIFFVPEWPALDSSVVHSQVLAVAAFLTRSGFTCHFVGAETSTERAHEASRIVRERYGIEATVYACLPSNARALGMWKSCRSAYWCLRRDLSKWGATHVYSRSFIAESWVRKLARPNALISVFDVRGVVADEHYLSNGNGWKRLLITFLEKRSIRSADRVATVSGALKEHIFRSTGCQNTVVIPSCFDEKTFHYDPSARAEIRQTLGLTDDEVLLCYSGGIAQWQRIEDIIELLMTVCAGEPRYKAMFLTHEKEAMELRLKAFSFPAKQVFVRRCRHDEVARYLSSADVGVIMRHDTIVNNVASPIKVAEYLGCGLPVIMTRGIGDYSDSLPAAGVGLLLDESKSLAPQVVNFIERTDFTAIKEAAQRFALRTLTMSANLDRYQDLYQSG